VGAAATRECRCGGRAFSGYLVKYRLAIDGLRLHAAVPYVSGTSLYQIGEDVIASWDPPQAVTVANE
jgi:hypothetical protein